MGRALKIASGRVTNPGGTLTGITVNTGDAGGAVAGQFTIPNFPFGSRAYLVDAWAQEAAIGTLRIRSARMHDQAQGIRLLVGQSSRPLLGDYGKQLLYPQDVLTVELSGGGGEVDVGAMLWYFDDLPGIDARLYSWEEIEPRILNLAGMVQVLTTGATVGDYGGSQALNADFDTWKRDVEYAILGYTLDVAVGIVGITGPDTGNTRLGGPGTTDQIWTDNWFVRLSKQLGVGCIPVINAANIGATTIDLVHTAAGTTVNLSLVVAELASAGVR